MRIITNGIWLGFEWARFPKGNQVVVNSKTGRLSCSMTISAKVPSSGSSVDGMVFSVAEEQSATVLHSVQIRQVLSLWSCKARTHCVLLLRKAPMILV